MEKLVGFVVSVFLIGFFLYQAHEAIGPALYIVPLVLIGIFIFFLVVYPKMKEQALISASKHDGPMEIELRVERIADTKWRLHIDAKISQKDIKALKQSGLEQYVLFLFPDKRRPDMDQAYCGITLLYVRYVDFTSIIAAEGAKEAFLKNLHMMRARLDQTMEHLEEQARGTTEKYEI